MTHPPSVWLRFLAEMKRRKVFRALAIYGTTAFALLQLADLVSPAFGLPASFVDGLVVFFLSAFPFAVLAAWTFDLTSYGWHRTRVATNGELEAILALPRLQRWSAGLIGVMGVLLLVLGSWWVGEQTGAAYAQELTPGGALVVEPVLSVAVLPLENMGPASDEAFTAGLTVELGFGLSQLAGVRVAAHTSAFARRGESIDARAIGRDLRVGTIVEGSVRRSGERVRISIELSRTSDGFRVWAQTWEQELTAGNMFVIQDEITVQVGRALTELARPAQTSAAIR